MLNLFSRYRSLNNTEYTEDASSSSVSEHRKTKKGKKSSSKSALSFSKNTRHLDLALNKHPEPAPDLSQRYTRFPPPPTSKSHELRPLSASEPTHQRLVISGQHSNHQRLNLQRTMPKSKPTPSRSGESSSRAAELDRSGSFMNKPARGWLHPDRQITETGICYGVRYVGCLEVTTSMKSLDFDTRSQIAKECINKVCESGGLKTVDKKRKVDKRILRMLGDKPNMEFAGSNVNLTITSRSLNLTIMETGELIAEHEMPNVSFASGGDPDTLDFVAYVAKDHMYGRACFVLECGGGLAQDVITTVGQAFELRFKQYLTRAPPASSDDSLSRLTAGASFGPVTTMPMPSNDDPEYYNDLPGKIPPDLPPEPPAGTKTLNKPEMSAPGNSGKPAIKNLKKAEPIEAVNECVTLSSSDKKATSEKLAKGNSADNLIDLNEELVAPSKKPEPEYVNCSIIAENRSQLANVSAGSSSKPDSDPFDLQPFEGTLPSSNLLKPLSPLRNNNTSSSNAFSNGMTFFPDQSAGDKNALDQKQALLKEVWFHGPISRKESEILVVSNGDFLVRESQGSPGQYVLTGMQGGIKKHLLLVDPEGVVRTKDRTFESVSHLINYHSKNGLPIIAADSALVLSKPIRMRT